MHAVAGSRGWAVLTLQDGRPLDHVPYPTWSDAVKAAGHDRDRYVFLEIQPDGMQPPEAVAVLKYARTLHALGYRIPGPDFAGEVTAMPLRKADRARMAKQLVSGRPLVPAGFAMSNLPSERGRR